MPVNLNPAPTLPAVSGIRLASVAAGVRVADRLDLTLIECVADTSVAAVFTRNRFRAAPVLLAQQHLQSGAGVRGLVINTGNANAGTGEQGIEAARRSCEAAAAALGCRPEEILPFSTGVIGEPLPVNRLVAALPGCAARLDANGWNTAADAIRTTDTVPKGATRQLQIDGAGLTLTGIAKGSGMIRPDMATMLAFVATDARIEPAVLQDMLQRAVAGSFHCISVDGDTSTNDACVLLASGQAGHAIGERGPARDAFQQALDELFLELAQALVRDAEGASKFISLHVRGGASDAECARVAFTIAESPLVKTAFFASDANWGRILAAIGRAPQAEFDMQQVGIRLNGLEVVRDGGLLPEYDAAAGQASMAAAELRVDVELGSGPGSAQVWTSDLSHEYVRINAEYRS